MFDEIPKPTIELPKGRFQTFPDISLSEELRWKSDRFKNKTFITRAALAYRMKCEIKRPYAGEVGILLLRNGKFVIWKLKSSRFSLREVAADRSSRSTGVNPSRKQRCCSPSCLWSQAQRDTSDQDNSPNLGYWLTLRHRCICMWSWTEMLTFFPVDSKDCMSSASYEYRNVSARRGAQYVSIGMPTICWNPPPQHH